jgi:hypothetical protein
MLKIFSVTLLAGNSNREDFMRAIFFSFLALMIHEAFSADMIHYSVVTQKVQVVTKKLNSLSGLKLKTGNNFNVLGELELQKINYIKPIKITGSYLENFAYREDFIDEQPIMVLNSKTIYANVIARVSKELREKKVFKEFCQKEFSEWGESIFHLKETEQQIIRGSKKPMLIGLVEGQTERYKPDYIVYQDVIVRVNGEFLDIPLTIKRSFETAWTKIVCP